jgi:hypothetical protein
MQAVRAKLNYLAPMNETPIFCGPDVPGTNLIYDPEDIVVRDARQLKEPSALEREGFTLVEHRASECDFQDRDVLDGSYGAEVAELITSLTGACDVRVVPGSTGRFVDRNIQSKAAKTLPAARFIHWDYTDKTAHTVFLPQITRIMGTDAQSALQRYRRITIYQTWRALSGPAQDVPLALVDGRTVKPSDLITCSLGRPPESSANRDDANSRYADGKLSEFSLSRYSREHAWYYFPKMRRDELLVFKGYEYKSSRQLPVLHTAFDDPGVPPDTPSRTSVEVRLFAFYE